MTTSITFLGAAQNVTGSSYAVDVDDTTLLVDCGIYQERALKSRNWDAFPVTPARVKAVLLTHAHLDHCGLLPKLVRDGFSGPIYCTAATAEIAKIVLLDSAKIQEEDALTKAKRHEREGRRGPFPDAPLYTTPDAEAVLPLLTPVAYDKPVPVALEVQAVFAESGHILGSAMIELKTGAGSAARTILFSGDLGRNNLPILRDPATGRSSDYVVVESTYGDRLHEAVADIPEELARILNATRQAGGKVVIPAFAIERTQELIYYLNLLLRAGKIPRIPIYIDSPMAIRVTEVFSRHPELFDDETKAWLKQSKRPEEFSNINMTGSAEESKAINKVKGPAVIIAGSGMCNGGRIKHHLTNTIGRPENTILFVGYQAGGTLGREILDGAKDVRILGRQYRVRAHIEQLRGFSAHADRNEILGWLKTFAPPPRRIYVTHGEAASASALAAFVQEQTGCPAFAPIYKQREVLA